MINNMLHTAQNYLKENRNKRKMRIAVGAFSVIVALAVLIILISPGFADEPEYICGMVEHTHTDACYLELICGEDEGHVHDEWCYEAPLLCTMPTDHEHDSTCYAEPSLICGLEESEGLEEGEEAHTHDASCYGEPELICGIEENHVHNETCYGEPVLICTETGHIHDEGCYVVSEELQCGLPEHEHDESCLPGDVEEEESEEPEKALISKAFEGLMMAMGDIKGYFTFSYYATDSNDDPIVGDDFYFNVWPPIYTLNIDWEIIGGYSISEGDYFELPMTFAAPVTIGMTKFTFDLLVEGEIAGTVTFSRVTPGALPTTDFMITVEFNDFLEDKNNVEGTITFQFKYQSSNPEGTPQAWWVGDKLIAEGEEHYDDYTIITPTVRPPGLFKIGFAEQLNPPYELTNAVIWNVNINGQGLPIEQFFDHYTNFGESIYDGTPPSSVTISDTLGPGQVLVPFENYPNHYMNGWANDPSYAMYGGNGDDVAYFMVYAADLEKIWEFLGDPANEDFIKSWLYIGDGSFSYANYLSIEQPGFSWDGNVLEAGGYPITDEVYSFILNVPYLYAYYGINNGWDNPSDGYYWVWEQMGQIRNECFYIPDGTEISNIQRSTDGFSFDIAATVLDGRMLCVRCCSTITNPAYLEPVGPNTPIMNYLSLEFEGVKDETDPYWDVLWLSGGGTAKGDTNTLTIFKKSSDDSGQNLSGAEFTVERLGTWNGSGYDVNSLVTGGAVYGVITLTTVNAGGGDYCAATGSLGAYSATDVYKITEIRPPSGFNEYSGPIYLTINPSGYAITLCDEHGSPITPPVGAYGLCDSDGTKASVGNCIYVINNENLPGNVTIYGRKTIEGSNAPADTKFAFALEYSDVSGVIQEWPDELTVIVTGGTWDDENRTITVSRGSGGAGDIDFSIEISGLEASGSADTLHYFTLVELGGGGVGWTNATNEYLLRINVPTSGGTGTVNGYKTRANDSASWPGTFTTTNVHGSSTTYRTVFKNTYEPPSDGESSVDVSIIAVKEVEGTRGGTGIPTGWSFPFNLYNSDSFAAQGILVASKNAEEATPMVTFGLPTYWSANTYYYLLKEDVPPSPWVPDNIKQYHIRVTVTSAFDATVEYRERDGDSGTWSAWKPYSGAMSFSSSSKVSENYSLDTSLNYKIVQARVMTGANSWQYVLFSMSEDGKTYRAFCCNPAISTPTVKSNSYYKWVANRDGHPSSLAMSLAYFDYGAMLNVSQLASVFPIDISTFNMAGSDVSYNGAGDFNPGGTNYRAFWLNLVHNIFELRYMYPSNIPDIIEGETFAHWVDRWASGSGDYATQKAYVSSFISSPSFTTAQKDQFWYMIRCIDAMVTADALATNGKPITSLALSYTPSTTSSGSLSLNYSGYQPPTPPSSLTSNANFNLKLTWTGTATVNGVSGGSTGVTFKKGDALNVTALSGDVKFTVVDPMLYLVSGSIHGDFFERTETPNSFQKLATGASTFAEITCSLTIRGGETWVKFLNVYDETPESYYMTINKSWEGTDGEDTRNEEVIFLLVDDDSAEKYGSVYDGGGEFVIEISGDTFDSAHKFTLYEICPEDYIPKGDDWELVSAETGKPGFNRYKLRYELTITDNGDGNAVTVTGIHSVTNSSFAGSNPPWEYVDNCYAYGPMLPETGGDGLKMLMFTGLTMMALAGVALIVTRLTSSKLAFNTQAYSRRFVSRNGKRLIKKPERRGRYRQRE